MEIIKSYLYLVKTFLKYGKLYTVLLFFTTLLSPIATVIDTLIIKISIDAITSTNPLYKILPFLLIYVFAAVFLYVASALFAKYSSLELIKIGNKMNKAVYKMAKGKDYVNTESPDFYDSYSWTVQGYFSRSLSAIKSIASIITILLTIVAIIGLIAVVDWVVISFSFLNLFVVVLLNILARKLEYRKKLELLKIERSDSYIQRTFYIPDYAADIRITGLCGFLIKKLDANKDEKIRINKYYLNKNFIIFFFIKIFPMVIFVLSIVYLIIKTSTSNATYGDFALLLTASQNLTSELLVFSDLIPGIVEQGLYAKKIVEFEAMQTTIESSINGRMVEQTPCSIKFENVCFAYSNSSNNAISNLSFTIEPKEKIAIVGKNGAGKSTIVKLLLRLYDPNDGKIFINGIDIKDYSIKSLRNSIGNVMQNCNLYALSLKENIFINQFGEEMCDDNLDEYFSSLDLKKPKTGYDSSVTKEFVEDGLVFSGGERQKISLIRVMTKYYPLIIMDEPTSSLDPLSENRFIDATYKSFDNSTLIMVAHRLSNIRNFDKILVVDNGQLVEFGNHDKLMGKHGLYYEMFVEQARRYCVDNK